MSERMSSGEVESRRLKRKMEVEEKPSMNERIPKSLKLFEDSSPSNYQPMREEKTHQFICKFCKKTFPNSQALGGHQNAHKRERVLLNFEKEMGTNNMIGFGSNLLYPYSLPSHLPFRGTHHYQAAANLHHPMPHVPTMSPWPYQPRGYGFPLSMHRFGMNNGSWGGSGSGNGTLAPTTPSPFHNPSGLTYALNPFPSLADTTVQSKTPPINASLQPTPTCSTMDSSQKLDLTLRL